MVSLGRDLAADQLRMQRLNLGSQIGERVVAFRFEMQIVRRAQQENFQILRSLDGLRLGAKAGGQRQPQKNDEQFSQEKSPLQTEDGPNYTARGVRWQHGGRGLRNSQKENARIAPRRL
jgi:hypothetical protein